MKMSTLQIGRNQFENEFPAWGWVSGHLRTLIWSTGHWLKVWRCPTPKILLFSSWYFMQIVWWESIGHLRTLSQRCPMLRIKVWRCPETRTRAGNSSSNWPIQNPLESVTLIFYPKIVNPKPVPQAMVICCRSPKIWISGSHAEWRHERRYNGSCSESYENSGKCLS